MAGIRMRYFFFSMLTEFSSIFFVFCKSWESSVVKYGLKFMSVFETECEWTLLHGGLHNANTDLSVRLIKDKPTERIKRWLKLKASSYGCYPAGRQYQMIRS